MAEIVLYGAASDEGKLYAQALVAAGFKPLLADNTRAVHQRGQALLCPASVVKHNGDWESVLSDTRILINVKAPYKKTQKPLVAACLATQTHYLDFCDDVAGLRYLYQFNNHAQDKNIMMMPGVGLMPIVLVVNMIKTLLNRPHQLVLFHGEECTQTQVMRSSWLNKLRQPPVARRKGTLIESGSRPFRRVFELQGRRFSGLRDHWHGELFLSGLDTSIANMDVYGLAPAWAERLIRWRLTLLSPLMALFWGSSRGKELTEAQLKAGRTWVKAVVANSQDTRTLALVGPHPAKWRALCLAAIVKEIMKQHAPPGYQTPSVYGKALLDKVGSVTWLKQ